MPLFRFLVGAGTILLGAALLIAPVLAFTDRMTIVSALGIAGMVLLLAGWLVRKFTRPDTSADESSPER